MADSNKDDFDRALSETPSGFLREFWEFLGQNKKWWILPIAVVLALLALLTLLSSTAAAPFIYTIF
jgi:drug/metabolite transporter superfamily protein YnfA